MEKTEKNLLHFPCNQAGVVIVLDNATVKMYLLKKTTTKEATLC